MLFLKSVSLFKSGILVIVWLLKADGGVKVLTVWVVVRVKGFSWAELFVVVLRKRQISHHRCVAKKTMHGSWNILIFAYSLTSIGETAIGSEFTYCCGRGHDSRHRI